jgi:hypothetical protein
MAGDSKAKVIPLHGNSGRAAAQRRAGQRTQASRQHPSLLSEPGTQASAEQIAAVVREIDHHRRAAGAGSEAEQPNNELAQKVSSIADFLRHRLTGDYSVDEFGFDPHFNEAIVRPLLRFFFKSWPLTWCSTCRWSARRPARPATPWRALPTPTDCWPPGN